MISIVDYGLGNVGSISNMLKRIGVAAELVRTGDQIRSATSLILPGVGAFDRGMQFLVERALIEPLNESVLRRGVPVLGHCLGMQLMANSSEEGGLAGLGWLGGTNVRFRSERASQPIKIPHMGWNELVHTHDHPLLDGVTSESRFYFVHSYHLADLDDGTVIAKAVHGYEFPAVVARRNIMGVQFHPEKSHRFGMHLLQNFANIAGSAQATTDGLQRVL